MKVRNPEDTGKTAAWAALIGAISYGIYKWVVKPEEPGIPSELKITKCQNLETGETVSSGFLNVRSGDIVRVFFEYGYFGPALSGTYHVSLWQDRPWDPHDEVGSHDEVFDIPAHPELTKIEDSIDIEIKAGEGDYGLYMKIMGIPEGDIFTPYYANRIRVTGEAPPEGYETLEIDITPAEGGYVKTNPASREGRNTWNDGNTGTFLYGTNIQVTAIPNSGYQFEKWSDEITGGISYNNPEYVKPMTEHRAVKAHFREEAVPPAYVDFRMNIDGDAAGRIFHAANRWMCFYFNPELGQFVGDNEWHFLFWGINFKDVAPNGYLAVFLYSTVTGIESTQLTSPTWDIMDGATYEYDPIENVVIRL